MNYDFFKLVHDLLTSFDISWYLFITFVFSGSRIEVQTSEEVAIKLESIKSKHPQLLYATGIEKT
jgi:hypothetical protein